MMRKVATDATGSTEEAVNDAQGQRNLLPEAHRLYDTYVQPLEQEHRGEYVAISSDGRYVLASTEIDALHDGVTTLGPDPFIFEVGQFATALRR